MCIEKIFKTLLIIFFVICTGCAILIGYERCSFFTGLGPFKIVGKGSVVYKIDYEINDARKECWVRFSGFLEADWRM